MMQARGLAIGIWLVSMLMLTGVIVRTSFSTDMSAFLPRAPAPEQQVLVDQIREGVASRLILIGIEGASAPVLAAVSQRLAEALRKRAEFVRVDNGDTGIGEADRQYVWRHRYVLAPATGAQQFSASTLRAALENDLDLLASGMAPLLEEGIVHDPSGAAMRLSTLFAGDYAREMRNGVWTSKDGQRALLLAQTHAAGFDIDGQELALSVLRDVFAEAQRAVPGADSARLIASGAGVFGVKTRAEMKHDVSLYSTAAVVVIVVLLLTLYRSLGMLALTMVPVVSGAVAGLAAVSLWCGFVHGITVGFGVTLIGESVDYAIYLFVQSERHGGTTASMARLWPTLRLGALVSICGFLVMLFSSFTGFMQLGIFTIAGLATALAVTRFVLPQLVPQGYTWTREISFAATLLTLVKSAHRARVALCLVTIAALLYSAAHHAQFWQDDLASMSPIAATDQAVDRELRHAMGGPDVRFLVTASASDLESLLQLSERSGEVLEHQVAAGVLAGYDAPHRYLPSMSMQKMRQEALPDDDTLRRNLAQALIDLPFQPGIFAPFLADVAAARQAPAMQREALAGTALALKLDTLLSEKAGTWTATLPLRDVAAPQRLAAAFVAHGLSRRTHVVLIDLKAESDLLLHRYRHESLVLAGCGGMVIALLLFGWFRSIRRCAVVLAPLIVAIVLTIAVLLLERGPLSIFNVFGLLLVIAVGSNYCLFFQRSDLLGEHGGRTVTSLLVANVCTVIGFGALSLSRLPVLFDLGRTVALGTALSLIAAAILTPGLARADRPTLAESGQAP